MKETLRYLAGLAGPSGYGSNSTAEQVTEDCSLPSQLTAIITGATSGIGAETARVMAKRGVRVIIPARDLKKAGEMKERIQKESPKAEVIVLEIDLSSFASIKRFCSEFLSLGLPLHILINNAGKFSHKLEFSEDKIEMSFATNYLELLIEKMVETAAQTGIQGRIINVSSVIHSWVKRDGFRFNQMLNPKNYNGTRAYAQSKLANILHAKELARQLKARNARVTINAVHPGIGASTTCYVGLSRKTEGVSGKYYADCNECSCSSMANDESEAHNLWRQSRALIHRRLRLPAAAA
ncbi:Short-chain dehydrogenase TIC 32, chloroplastic [Vitis vinifera]|uniref:Short-chain dehydrogenase TIC 32, chloroplastic n=1 Tax=Vitis vinifera TaxID=29760 RepID=A0A438EZ91_VITVI|nr:Short-chain dehydrogenase TIC 32, chloroplastic [Vitis vinifera]